MFCIRLVTPLNTFLWPAKFSFVAMAILIASSTMRSELMCDKSARCDTSTRDTRTTHHSTTPTHVTMCLPTQTTMHWWSANKRTIAELHRRSHTTDYTEWVAEHKNTTANGVTFVSLTKSDHTVPTERSTQ